MSWTAQKINNLFLTPSHPVVESFRAQHFQKSRKFHELPRKWFHFRGHMEGGMEEEGRSKGTGRWEEGG